MEELDKLIVSQIRNNRLANLGYEMIISQLSVLNNKPYELIKMTLDRLVGDKKVNLKCVTKDKSDSKAKSERIKTPQTDAPKSPYSRGANIDLAYDILNRKDKKSSSKVKKVEGKIQGTSKGYAFLIPTDITMDDIFVPERELGGAMHGDRVVVSV